MRDMHKKISFTVQNSDVLPILLHRQVLNMNITLILGMVVCNYAGYYFFYIKARICFFLLYGIFLNQCHESTRGRVQYSNTNTY